MTDGGVRRSAGGALQRSGGGGGTGAPSGGVVSRCKGGANRTSAITSAVIGRRAGLLEPETSVRSERPSTAWLPSPIRWAPMAISCVYCGGRHDTSAEVRQCWSRTDRSRRQFRPPAFRGRSRRNGPTCTAVECRCGRCRAGPKRDCQAWSTSSSTAGQMRHDMRSARPRSVALVRSWSSSRRLAADRRPCVFEIDPASEAQLGAPESNTDALHLVGPRFTFELSTLNHVLWCNSIDARVPQRSAWPLAEAALAAGRAACR